ncbi:MAG: MAE_28990/MAE_18760 family HEPN-like nuclease [Enhygromyxa sp.]
MQSALITTFNARSAEIDLYIQHVLHLAEPDSRQLVEGTGVDHESTQTIQKMHKASCFLALYNLVESTARSIVEEISCHINRDGITVKDLSATLQRSLIRGSFKDYQQQRREEIALVLLELAYRQDSITCFPNADIKPTSGNVDARWLRSLAECYGFSVICGPLARNGADLLTVKSRRNGLAHGNFTFADCGKEYTVDDIRDIAESTINFLKDIVSNVSTFLAHREFSVTASFQRLPGLTDEQRASLLARFREPREVFKASQAELLTVPGMNTDATAAIVAESVRLGYNTVGK